jgi:hypothetical protein
MHGYADNTYSLTALHLNAVPGFVHVYGRQVLSDMKHSLLHVVWAIFCCCSLTSGQQGNSGGHSAAMPDKAQPAHQEVSSRNIFRMCIMKDRRAWHGVS